jgi:hypothetical protein
VPTVKADAVCLAALDTARAAAVEEAGMADHVGDAAGHEAEADRTLTHLFDCLAPGYRGWRWAVTVTRVPRARSVTVSEVVLLPGPDALLAPEWVPWNQRVEPGDLAPGAILPTDADDPRLDPGFSSVSAAASVLDEAPEAVADLVRDLGLGRGRVLSVAGQDEAAARWHDSDAGQEAAIAAAAPKPCRTCGFLVPVGGPLGGLFGVCANGMAPDDGRVVALDHGCGAHSEIAVPGRSREWSVPDLVYDSVEPGLPF